MFIQRSICGVNSTPKAVIKTLMTSARVTAVWIAKLTRPASLAPKYRAITTLPPIAAPSKKLTIMNINVPEVETAARAVVPRNLPTISESTTLYSCWKTWLMKNGKAKDNMTEYGDPCVRSRTPSELFLIKFSVFVCSN